MSSIKWRFMAWGYCKNRAVSCAVKQPEKNFLIDPYLKYNMLYYKVRPNQV